MMKLSCGFFAIIIAISLSLNSSAQGPDTWVQKANFGGGVVRSAVGFSIGSKGYIGTGWDNSGGYHKDFWEYDPASDTWTQKADFGGTARDAAVGFNIGAKGYIGTGEIQFHIYVKDFWEYDPSANTWTQKADFGGAARGYAVGFSIGAKGYIGTGEKNGVSAYTKDFWEYDPSTNTWTQKADFGGGARWYACGFNIGSKGYLGTGDNAGDKEDFWEFNPNTNSWTQKANFGGSIRYAAVGFNIDNHGYIGTGCDYNGYHNDFWEYDTLLDQWTKKADFGGLSRMLSVGYSIGHKGYIGTGSTVYGIIGDFWEYITSCGLPPVTFKLCFDSITNLTAKPFGLKGGIPLGGIYSGPGVNSVTGIFNPSIAGTGIKTIIYTYTNAAMCSWAKSKTIIVQPDPGFTCGNDLTDFRDNQVYPTILIGTQCWMQKNLNYGNVLQGTISQTDNCVNEKYCYNDDAANCTKYGGLYQWDEMMAYEVVPGSQGLCPPGWHVPTETEWGALFAFYQGQSLAGKTMQDSINAGFQAKESGVIYSNISWNFKGTATIFWTSLQSGNIKAVSHSMNIYNLSVADYIANRSNAFALRCLKY